MIGDDSIVDDYGYFSTRVPIGRCTHIASGCSVAGGQDRLFSIGDFCSLSSGVKIWCTSDDFVNDLVTIIPQDAAQVKTHLITGDVTLENYTAVGANSVVMPRNIEATATNVFAHIEDFHEIVESILILLSDAGMFVSESHYLMNLETLQYDTIYHEHLRHYSLHSLQHLLNLHGLEVVHAKRIPTHGGSIRVSAARNGAHAVRPTVADMRAEEDCAGDLGSLLADFRKQVVASKLDLHGLLDPICKRGERIYGIGAPSRASTLINYTGLDDGILACVLEVKGSLKVGKSMPGAVIPAMKESRLYADQPEYALLLSWHIADELIPKIRENGFRGKYVVPLPIPRIVGPERELAHAV